MASESSSSTQKVLLLLAVVTGITILVGLGYFGSKLNTIEDRLATLSDPTRVTQGQQADHTVYVPAYSHVYSDGGLPVLLEVSLHLRSTDPKTSVTLTRVEYYNTAGKLLSRYVTSPQQLGPLESRSFIVAKTDYKGGSGANFIVQWRADGPVNPPLIEAVMVGIDPEYSFSFVRSGTSVTGFED